MKRTFTPAILGLALLGACQTTHKPGPENPPQAAQSAKAVSQAGPDDSSIEISYVLGHNLHQFKAQAQGTQVRGASTLDRQPLKEGEIDLKDYQSLLQRTSDWMNGAQRKPASSDNDVCRSPFSVTLRIGNESKSTQGCRTQSDATTFSRIARDAEFLLYSKN